MSVKRWKLGWKRCDCVKCDHSLTVEQTEENCGWVMWEHHKEEVARLKAEVDALKLGSLMTAVDVLQFINLKAEVERLQQENNLLRMRAVDDPAIRRALLEVVYERMRAECK